MGFFKAIEGALSSVPVLGSYVGAAVDLASGLFGASQQNSYNMEMAKYQNAYNTQMWHMQNEYNSPKATMRRLVEAGINPRAYQNIGQFANAGSPAPSASVSKVSELAQFQGVAKNAAEIRILQEQAKNMEMERKLTYRRSLNEEWKHNDLKLKHFITAIKNGVNPETFVNDWLYLMDEFDGQAWFTDVPLYQDFKNKDEGLYYLSKLGVKNKNDADKLLIELRRVEKELKDRELKDYTDFGITRGGSLFSDIPRGISRLIELLIKLFE